MEKQKVFFTSMRCEVGTSLLTKLGKLMDKAGIGAIDFERKFTVIKIHFGEPGNLAFLRPNFAKTVADKVKSYGGMPFLSDCSTLYPGRRKDALEHLDAAYENGFSPFSTGCQIVMGDGLKGTDDVFVPVDGEYVEGAYIGRAIMDADVFISLSHFKGHEVTGFGGALKNIGMGCGSRAGKMAMHCSGKPLVNGETCRSCGLCFKACAQDAISFGKDKKAAIDHDKCVGCGRCIGSCNFGAIKNKFDAKSDILNAKIAEYAKAVVQNRPNFHINIVMDVSPFCDCHRESDTPIVPDLGIFASFDPVALDQACVDAVIHAPAISSSILSERECAYADHFKNIHPNTNWSSQLSHAEKIELGTREYELIDID